MKTLGYFSGSFLLLALFGSSALGQQRTFVSGLGNDANPCRRTSPCRTFAQAISLTNAGGEVVVLDSAGYGPFVITQAVSILVNTSSTGVATARVSNSIVTHNLNGLANFGPTGVLLSRRNNTVEGNLNDTAGTITIYAPK